MRAMGLEATDDEFDRLFDTLDTDNSGEMDVDEVRDALTKMQASSQIRARRTREHAHAVHLGARTRHVAAGM